MLYMMQTILFKKLLWKILRRKKKRVLLAIQMRNREFMAISLIPHKISMTKKRQY